MDLVQKCPCIPGPKKACCHIAFTGANLAHIQPEYLENVQKMRFWQKALGVRQRVNDDPAGIHEIR